MVGYTAAADLFFVFISFVWIESPVLDIPDTYSVDVGVKSYDLFTCSHVAENISLGIDFHLVKPQASHLFGDTLDVRFLIAALAWELNDIA